MMFMLDVTVLSPTQSVDQAVQLLDVYKYLVLFPIAVIEGPFITLVAGFVASLGFINFFLAYFTVVVADLFADLVFFALGKHGGRPFVTKWGRFLGIDQKKAQTIEHLFHKHGDKTLWLGKTTLALGLAFIIIAGVVNYPFKKFLAISTISTAIKSLILLALGYYFGQAILQIHKNLNYIFVGSTIFVLAIIFIYVLIQVGKKATENDSGR